LTSFLMAVPVALSTVLFAVAAANPRVIAQKLRFALKLSLLIGVPAMVALFFGAHFALSLFGRAYASEATVPLMWLSLAYVPALPKNYYIAVCRAEGNISRAAVVLTAFAVAEIVAAGIGGRIDGLDGLSVAIFAVTLIEGMATTPAVLRAIRRDNRPQRTRKMTQGSASIETPANAWGRPDYNGRMRTQGRSTTSAGTLSIYNDSLDYPQQINSRSRDQQAEGIAVLERLARNQRQAESE
jgi:O-antigen/teichoic acid export membrane protein